MKRSTSRTKKRRQPTCKQCKTRFSTTDKRRKLCDSCKLEPFFQSKDYMFLLQSLKKLPYLEQFPNNTEGLIELLEYNRFCKAARGYHIVENEHLPLWDFSEQEQFEWKHHHSLDMSHLYPKEGTPTNKNLKGKLVTSNLILLPKELNRAMGNSHAMGESYFDTRSATKLSDHKNKKLMNFLASNYDLLEVTRRLKRFTDASYENTEPTKSFDAPKMKLMDILAWEFERLSLCDNEQVRKYFSEKLKALKEYEQTKNNFEEFDFSDDFDEEDFTNLSEQGTHLISETHVDTLTEEQFCTHAFNDIARQMQKSYQTVSNC